MKDAGALSTAQPPDEEPAWTPDGERSPGAVRRRPWGTVVLAALVLVLLALTVPMAVAAVPMLQGRQALEDARTTLAAGEIAAAGTHLDEAERRFRVARIALRNPLGWLGGAVPGIGNTQRTAAELALAGELIARGGVAVTEAVDGLPDGLRSLAPSGGAFPVESIRSLEPALAGATADVARAQEALAAAPAGFVLEPVDNAREQLDTELADLAPGLHTAHAFSDVLPAFLGADGPRRYFFGASQIAELRGAGGFIGAFATVTAEDGRLTFEDFSTIHDLPNPEPGSVEPPTAEIEARYERHAPMESWKDVGISADFPTTGAHLVELHTATVGDSLDGVIVADPFALAELLRVAGPTDVPGFGPVDHDTAVGFVSNEAFAHFDGRDERQHALGMVATAALTGFLEHGGDSGGLLDAAGALAEAVSGGHLRVYATRPDEQAAFEAAGAAGALSPDRGDLLDLSINSASNAKVDFFLETELDYQVHLLPDGGAHGHVTAQFTNNAPTDGQPRYVIGPARPGFEAGDNRFLATLACGTGCTFDAFSRDGEADHRMVLDTERERQLLTTPVQLASGAAETIEATWETPSGAWEQDGDRLTYRLTLRTPPTVTPADVTLAVAVPDGMRVERAPGMEQQGNTVVFEGTVRGSETFEVTLGR